MLQQTFGIPVIQCTINVELHLYLLQKVYLAPQEHLDRTDLRNYKILILHN